MIPRYLSYSELPELFGWGSTSRVQELLARDRFLDPDVIIGRVGAGTRLIRGWDKLRVIAWGVETGRLERDGTPVRLRGGRPPRTKPDHWRTTPKLYLSITQVAELIGRSTRNTSTLQQRPDFPDPDVQVGSTYGYTMDTAIRFGLRCGALDPRDERYRMYVA